MDTQFQQEFQHKWEKYFPGAGLPVAYMYTDTVSAEDRADSQDEEHCIIASFWRTRSGHTFVYAADSPGCKGFKRYTGFSQSLRPNFEFFLSCGIPGEIEGERYKKSPNLVSRYLESHPAFQAPGRFLVFKRWDKLAENDQPFAVIFFAPPDVLAGLFALANYDRADPDGVMSPAGSGCASIVNYPYWESQSEGPRCVLGMFDATARTQVLAQELTFTIPIKRFMEMVANMDESFLATSAWERLQARIQQTSLA
ncbi:MAG: DUF169 domain-containing protein [Anaerolineales bacterium]